jgi:hypothetical protein
VPNKKVYIPEVVEPDESLPLDLLALRKFARLMDEAVAIPGTKKRVGLDAGLSLIPVVGDVVGGLMSAVVIVGALRHRVRPLVIGRMLLNIAIDLLIGAIPVIGALPDLLFEQNMMNMQLLMKHRDRTRPPRSTSQIAFVAVMIVFAIFLFAVALAAAIIMGITWLMRS